MDEISKREAGFRIERNAEEWFLREVGGRLLARNYLLRSGEIDLIFECAGAPRPELVFVEVRARLPGNWQSGLESVGGAKQRRLQRAIRHFLAQYRGKAGTLRVDVLDWDGRGFRHYRNVWI